MGQPLRDVRVLDLTRLLPGGLATQLLVDLGAEVIKVEEPEVGDYMRTMPPTVGGVSTPFLMLNQGKKSVAINLKEEAGRALFYRLLAEADVVVEQFRPGVAERLGVGYEDVRRRRPDVVYCSLSSYGRDGPFAGRPGHDLNFAALSGLLHMNGAGRPVMPSTPVADVSGAVLVAYAIMGALYGRQRTGEGSHLDLSLYEAAIHVNFLNLAIALSGQPAAPGETLLTGLFACYNVYETADGRHVALGALEQKFWDRFCETVGHEELKEEHLRAGAEGGRVRDALERLFRRRSLDEWVEAFRDVDVPLDPVLTVEEALEHPQLRARGGLQETASPGGRIRTLRHPVQWTPEGPRREGTAPDLGEHTEAVLRAAGVSAQELRALERRGILRLGG